MYYNYEFITHEYNRGHWLSWEHFYHITLNDFNFSIVKSDTPKELLEFSQWYDIDEFVEELYKTFAKNPTDYNDVKLPHDDLLHEINSYIAHNLYKNKKLAKGKMTCNQLSDMVAAIFKIETKYSNYNIPADYFSYNTTHLTWSKIANLKNNDGIMTLYDSNLGRRYELKFFDLMEYVYFYYYDNCDIHADFNEIWTNYKVSSKINEYIYMDRYIELGDAGFNYKELTVCDLWNMAEYVFNGGEASIYKHIQ